MARVLGLGGFFIKSADPDLLRSWYRDMLGMEIKDWGGAQLPVSADDPAPYTVWSAFEATSDYFRPSQRDVMLNLRVDDLDALLADLRRKGAAVQDRREDGELGKFGYVLDPEGLLLELWEPNRNAGEITEDEQFTRR